MSRNTEERIDLSDAGKYGYRHLQRAGTPYEPRYFLDDSLIPSEYGHDLPIALKDLLDIAASIMWVDRTCVRSRDRMAYAPLRGWSRDLHVTLGVRELDLWRQPQVKETLQSLLFWLTEDTWDLQFEPYIGARRPSDLQPPLFVSSPHEHLIALYSGGLDSLAGVVRLLEDDSSRRVVLMSAVHNRQRLRQVIAVQVARLRERYGADRILFAALPFYVVKKRYNAPSQEQNPDRNFKREEHTQRTRGLLFLTFAAAVASALDAHRMVVCENGIGAINLPMDWCQLGTQNTRAVHPRTLLAMTNLLALIGLGHLAVEAPFMLSTKAEMCATLEVPVLRPLVRLTVSCDGFPHRLSNPTEDAQLHCGWCTSCVLRRQGIFGAGLGAIEAPSYYRRDLCAPEPDVKPSYFEPLKKMLDQAYIFEQAGQSSQADQVLSERFPELLTVASHIKERPNAFGVASGQDVLSALSDMYARYGREWKRFPYALRSVPTYRDPAPSPSQFGPTLETP